MGDIGMPLGMTPRWHKLVPRGLRARGWPQRRSWISFRRWRPWLVCGAWWACFGVDLFRGKHHKISMCSYLV